MNKLVSIIIPTYKRSDYLLQTIDSVLDQTYKNIEIIVVDDNGIGSDYQKSTQSKLQYLIDKRQIIYIPHKINKNGSAARNTGFRISKGSYINFLDDDDELLPDKIEKQVKHLSSLPENIGGVYCNSTMIFFTRFLGKRKVLSTNYTQEGNLIKEYLESKIHFNTSSLLFRRDVVEKLNGFDESYRRHQDYEFMLRFFTKWDIKCTPGEPLLLFDMTKDRINVLNLNALIEVKKKFLNQFENELKQWNLWDEINHFWWLTCGINAIDQKRFKLAQKLLSKSQKHAPFGKTDILSIIKAFIRVIVKWQIHFK